MRILIATDGLSFSKAAIARACDFIVPESTAINIVSAVEDIIPISTEPIAISPEYCQIVDDTLHGLAEKNVKEAVAEVRKCFEGKELDLTAQVIRGFPDQVIVQEAKHWDADLIVVGSHGRGFWGRMLGSVSSGVVHHAPCSVLVVRIPAAENVGTAQRQESSPN